MSDDVRVDEDGSTKRGRLGLQALNDRILFIRCAAGNEKEKKG